MAETKKFQLWAKYESLKMLVDQKELEKEVEKKVEESMKEENLKIKYF